MTQRQNLDELENAVSFLREKIDFFLAYVDDKEAFQIWAEHNQSGIKPLSDELLTMLKSADEQQLWIEGLIALRSGNDELIRSILSGAIKVGHSEVTQDHSRLIPFINNKCKNNAIIDKWYQEQNKDEVKRKLDEAYKQLSQEVNKIKEVTAASLEDIASLEDSLNNADIDSDAVLKNRLQRCAANLNTISFSDFPVSPNTTEQEEAIKKAEEEIAYAAKTNKKAAIEISIIRDAIKEAEVVDAPSLVRAPSPSSSAPKHPPTAATGGLATGSTETDPAIRAEHVKAKFKRYVERVQLIEGLVDIAANPGTKKYNDTIAEINRIKEDLECYIKIIDNKEEKKEEAKSLIRKLGSVINILENKVQDLGMRYFGEASIKVEASKKDEQTFADELEKKRNELLDKYDLTSTNPAGMIGQAVLSNQDQALKSETRYTASFTKMEDFVGRVNLVVTKPTTRNNTPIISTSVQRIKNGARVTVIQFAKDKETGKEFYDSSRRIRECYDIGLPVTLLPNDRLLKHAMKDVLNHILAEKSDSVKQQMSDAFFKGLMEGKNPKTLLEQLNPSPIFINGNMHNRYTESVMLFCKFIGVDCHDVRKGSKCEIIKKVDDKHFNAYENLLTQDPKRFLADMVAIVTPKERVEKLAVQTVPPDPSTPKPR